MLFFIFIILNCNNLSKEKVRNDFLMENPNSEIINIGPGEGDFDSVYYHIEYKRSKNSKIENVIWLYQKDNKGLWRLKNKNVP